MSDQQKETPAQVGRYLAMTHMFRAIIEMMAEIADRPFSEVADEIKSRVDHSTAMMRLTSIGNEDWQAAIQKMDLALKAIFAEYEQPKPN